MNAPSLALWVAILGCGGAAEPPPPEPPPAASPIRVRPPVIRIAIEQQTPVAALLDAPEEVLPDPGPPPVAPIPEEQREAYEAQRPKTVLELQPWRRILALSEEVVVIDLHPRTHRALLVQRQGDAWHLENPNPHAILVDLDHSDASGLALVHLADDEVIRCAPWSGKPSELDTARASGRPYVPVCDDHLLLRNTVVGNRSTLEWAAELVRSRVGGAEHIADLVKRSTQDRLRKAATIGEGGGEDEARTGPRPLDLAPGAVGATLARGDLGLPVGGSPHLAAGAWLPVLDQPGIYASLIAPRLAAAPPEPAARALVGSADGVEGGALVFLVAFDLDQLTLELEVGTEHPAVGWSTRARRDQVDPTLAGPDGIGTVAPLARAAMVPPTEALGLAATFTGGFKREHGAFRSGALAEVNRASHYGVIQDGLVLSKLQPGLATLVVYDDGGLDLTTWTTDRDAELDRILHARQNGVPLLQQVDGAATVSPLISDWRAGNWSGSATGEARTQRAGACIQQTPGGRFLLYAVFTAATPRTMARVLLAAGCADAMHLDMNALEHTYMATYGRDAQGGWIVHHLDRGMAVLDKKDRKGNVLPRFVAFPDNRDFFAVVPRRTP